MASVKKTATRRVWLCVYTIIVKIIITNQGASLQEGKTVNKPTIATVAATKYTIRKILPW